MAEKKSNTKDLTGQTFERLTVIERGPDSRSGQAHWICRCECGNQKLIAGSSLRNGLTGSCGCKHLDAGREKTIDMTNQKFGRLTVQSQAGSTCEGKALWSCLCECGNTVTVAGKELRNGHTKSCGCLRRDVTGDYSRTHGMSGTPEHKSWKAASQRCFNPIDSNYGNYGARGITMCDEWKNSFEAFLAHIGPRPSGTTLDRIDNEKGYEPGNVRWATYTQQANNRRSRWRTRL